MFHLTRAKRWLAIIVDDSSLAVAEAVSDGTETSIRRRAEFPLPPATNLENLCDVAAEFSAFLEQYQFQTRRAIFGLPSRYFLLHAHEMPRADNQTTALALWHHVSTVIAPEVGSVALDFVADKGSSNQQKLAIVGMQDRLLGGLLEFCERTEVEAVGVTPTVLALAAASAAAGPAALVVHANASTAEIVLQIDEIPRMMRQINGATPSTICSELRRASARLTGIMTSENTSLTTASASPPLVIWNAKAEGEADLPAYADASGLQIVSPLRQWIGVRSIDAAAVGRPDIGLEEMALLDYFTRPGRAAIDFLHPRLRAPRPRAASRRAVLIAGCAAAALLCSLLALTDIHLLQRSAAASQTALDEIEPDVRAAKPSVQRMQFASAFQSAEPRYLSCLRDLTVAVTRSDAVTLNHFDLNGAMQGSCSGEANVQQDAVDLVDRLSATHRFGRMNCKLDSHGATGKPEKVSFHIAFQYVLKG